MFYVRVTSPKTILTLQRPEDPQRPENPQTPQRPEDPHTLSEPILSSICISHQGLWAAPASDPPTPPPSLPAGTHLGASSQLPSPLFSTSPSGHCKLDFILFSIFFFRLGGAEACFGGPETSDITCTHTRKNTHSPLPLPHPFLYDRASIVHMGYVETRGGLMYTTCI